MKELIKFEQIDCKEIRQNIRKCQKVIFLDVDGVLNNLDTFLYMDQVFLATGETLSEIDERFVERLADIVVVTGAVIVLSSS